MERKNIFIFKIVVLLVISLIISSAAFAQQKNILIISIDDLRPELNSFGATYIHSPNIDSLVSVSRGFNRHYVNAPSCGPSRYAFLTGQYGFQYRDNGNQALFARAEDVEKKKTEVAPSMPEWFRNNGYATVSVGKVSHHPGGRGGDNWDDATIQEMPNAWNKSIMPVAEWEHPRGAMHGLSFGKIRTTTERDVLETVKAGDKSYPDGHIIDEGLRQLDSLARNEQPFFLAIGLIKPHLPFGVPKRYLDLYENIDIAPIPYAVKPKGATTWHNSNEFMSYNRRGKDPREDHDFALELKKYYAACVSYADKHVGDILDKLKETGADKNTIVVLWGDHGWHLGEHAIWGKHALFEESLRSPLVIYNPEMKKGGEMSNSVVESVDVFPTLCNLVDLPVPEFADGISLVPILNNPQADGHAAFGFKKNATTIRTDRYRMVLHTTGEIELYDHRSVEKEQLNIAAQNLSIVRRLKQKIKDKIGEDALIDTEQ